MTEHSVTEWLAQRGIKPTPCFSDIPVGWRPLVDRLITDLVALGWDRELDQVKEKFGGLRFYIEHGDEALSSRIREAEDQSHTVCEDCGGEGTLWQRRSRWVTHCNACAEAK